MYWQWVQSLRLMWLLFGFVWIAGNVSLLWSVILVVCTELVFVLFSQFVCGFLLLCFWPACYASCALQMWLLAVSSCQGDCHRCLLRFGCAAAVVVIDSVKVVCGCCQHACAFFHFCIVVMFLYISDLWLVSWRFSCAWLSSNLLLLHCSFSFVEG